MVMRSTIRYASAVMVVFGCVVMGPGTVGGSGPPQGDPGVDQPIGATNPMYRVSDSPWMQLPAELRNVPPMEPSMPSEIDLLEAPEDPTAVEVYESATGKSMVITDAAPTAESTLTGTRATEPYEGLLPAGMSLESIIGTDGRTQITSTWSYPYRTVAKLYVTFPDTAQAGCSGAIIDDFHVLTAGHCVYSHDHDGWATQIVVIPGLDGTYAPYYCAWDTYLRSYTGWTVSGMSEHDWAVITLDRNVGSFTGWMGKMTASYTNSVYTGMVNTAGYPGDKGGLEMWYSGQYGHSADEYNHWYYLDTYSGQSGSPVWHYDDGSRYTVSIHTCGTSGCGITSNGVNHGTRLNEDKFNRINTWLDSDTPPKDKPDLIDDGDSWSGFSPTAVTGGHTSFTVYCDVRNIGTASSGGFYVYYYASTNTTITSYDYLIGSDYVSSVSPFDSVDSNWTGVFPITIPEGVYYVGWIVDDDNSVDEFNESNNTGYKLSPTLTVAETDLVPQAWLPSVVK